MNWTKKQIQWYGASCAVLGIMFGIFVTLFVLKVKGQYDKGKHSYYDPRTNTLSDKPIRDILRENYTNDNIWYYLY